MKKTILALFVLLFILIVTCAYEKSHTIYAKTAKEHTAPAHTPETAPIVVVEEIIIAKTVEKKDEVKTLIQSKQPTPPQTEKNTPKPQDVTETGTVIASKEPAKTPVIPAKEKTIVAKTVEKKVEVKAVVQDEQPVSIQTPKRALSEGTKEEAVVVEQTLLSKLKDAVIKRLHSSEQKAEEKFLEESRPAAQENAPVVIENAPVAQENTLEVIENTPAVIENISLTVTYNTSEEEIVDHLVEALKNQEQAFKNRDKFMLEIEALIKRALDDRFIAIENRKKAHKVRLEEREIVSKTITPIYTINPGE